jgi:hypothetical protein
MAISIFDLDPPQEDEAPEEVDTEGTTEEEEVVVEQTDMMGADYDDWEENDDMDMFRLSQRFAGDDAEMEIQTALELLDSYNSEPLDDSPDVEDATAMVRDRVMGAWNQ